MNDSIGGLQAGAGDVNPGDEPARVDDWPFGDQPSLGAVTDTRPHTIYNFATSPDHIVATFALPIHLPLRDALVFQVPVRGEICLAAFERVEATKFHERSGIERAQGIEFVHDRHGELVYSRSDVKIPVSCVIAEGGVVEEDDDERSLLDAATDLTVRIVNAVLIGYRHLAKAHYITPIRRDDLSSLIVFRVTNGQRTLGRAQILARSDGFAQIEPPRDEVFHGELQSWLLEERLPEAAEELMLSAHDLVELRQPRMAVIEARAALEIAIDQRLLAAMVTKSVDPLVAAKVLRCGVRKLTSLQDVLRGARVNDKLGRGCRTFLDVEFPRSRLWPRWEKAKALREGAVHFGEPVADDEAAAAVAVIGEMLAML